MFIRLLVALLVLLVPSSAFASANLHVQGSAGQPLIAKVERQGEGVVGYSDEHGDFQTLALNPGDRVLVGRSWFQASTCFSGAPEGQGIAATVPANGQLTVTLPLAYPVRGDESWSEAEAGLLGALNRARTQRGLQPLARSNSLSRGAASIVRTTLSNGGSCGLPSPTLASNEYGWPSTGSSYQSAWEYGEAVERLVSHPQASDYSLSPKWTAVGVGVQGDSVALLFNTPDGFGCLRCEMTTDYGDPAIYDRLRGVGQGGVGDTPSDNWESNPDITDDEEGKGYRLNGQASGVVTLSGRARFKVVCPESSARCEGSAHAVFYDRVPDWSKAGTKGWSYPDETWAFLSDYQLRRGESVVLDLDLTEKSGYADGRPSLRARLRAEFGARMYVRLENDHPGQHRWNVELP